MGQGSQPAKKSKWQRGSFQNLAEKTDPQNSRARLMRYYTRTAKSPRIYGNSHVSKELCAETELDKAWRRPCRSRDDLGFLPPYPEAPSIETMPALGPKVFIYRWDLFWAIWSSGSVIQCFARTLSGKQRSVHNVLRPRRPGPAFVGEVLHQAASVGADATATLFAHFEAIYRWLDTDTVTCKGL